MSARAARLFSALAFFAAAVAGADEQVSVCFNYGCVTEADVVFSDGQLATLGSLLGRAHTPDEEREAIGDAVGRLLGWAGEQSPISADRGGNYADDAVSGRMDCIDHATTATRLLRLLERRGLLRFHRVLEPAERLRFWVFSHYAAQIEEMRDGGAQGGEEEGDAPSRFVVDGWFFDNGHPAAVMRLEPWRKGNDPDDGE
ncbi:MAG: hypothetical protein LBI59_04780 [Candidatus Accumulibacter sp.]|jgi:hypothetical protein|nr:hypothetical protein [Accumulibacter sp.]